MKYIYTFSSPLDALKLHETQSDYLDSGIESGREIFFFHLFMDPLFSVAFYHFQTSERESCHARVFFSFFFFCLFAIRTGQQEHLSGLYHMHAK